MKTFQGFISITAIIAIILGIGIVGGGTYYFVEQSKQSSTISILQDVPSDISHEQIVVPDSATQQSIQAESLTESLSESSSVITFETDEPMTTIHIPLVAVDQEDYYPGLIGPFGCGQYLAMMPRQVPATQAVLHATYQWMFSNPVSFDGGNYLNLAANPSQGNLKFNQVTVENGIAKVYLSGNIMANHCGDSIFAAQIEQAAFQYPGVQSIEVYLNNQIFNWCTISAAPEEGLCANGGSILWRRDK